MASVILGTSYSMASQLLSLSTKVSISSSSSLVGIPIQTTPSSVISVPTSTSSMVLPLIYCGRGDRKTARGKRFSHSYGNARPHGKKKGRGPPRAPVPPGPPKKDPYDDGQIIEIELFDD